MTGLELNLSEVRQRIKRAAVKAQRNDVPSLLAVTKTVPASVCAQLLALGQRDLGENRIDVLEEKLAHFGAGGQGDGPVWHFIGHIQRNKARRVVRAASILHSIDSARLLDTVARVAAEEERHPRIYLEVNATGEPEKHGMSLDDARELAARAPEFPSVTFAGLMAMGPLHPRPGRGTREVFEEVATLARELEASPALASGFEDGRVRLSMGMSGDLEVAVAAGSDVLRVGSALFAATLSDP